MYLCRCVPCLRWFRKRGKEFLQPPKGKKEEVEDKAVVVEENKRARWRRSAGQFLSKLTSQPNFWSPMLSSTKPGGSHTSSVICWTLESKLSTTQIGGSSTQNDDNPPQGALPLGVPTNEQHKSQPVPASSTDHPGHPSGSILIIIIVDKTNHTYKRSSLRIQRQNIDRLMSYVVKAGRDTAAATWVDRSCLDQNSKIILQPNSSNACSPKKVSFQCCLLSLRKNDTWQRIKGLLGSSPQILIIDDQESIVNNYYVR